MNIIFMPVSDKTGCSLCLFSSSIEKCMISINSENELASHNNTHIFVFLNPYTRMTSRKLYKDGRNKGIIQISIPQTYALTNPTIIC
jgi:hypothetical protein